MTREEISKKLMSYGDVGIMTVSDLDDQMEYGLMDSLELETNELHDVLVAIHEMESKKYLGAMEEAEEKCKTGTNKAYIIASYLEELEKVNELVIKKVQEQPDLANITPLQRIELAEQLFPACLEKYRKKSS